MNSWQSPNDSEPSVGTLHLFAESARSTAFDWTDSAVSTSWGHVDLSAKVPVGTKAIYGLCEIYSTDSADEFRLNVRDFSSTETDVYRTFFMWTAADVGAATYYAQGAPAIIKATNGKFSYSIPAGFAGGVFRGILWGYYL